MAHAWTICREVDLARDFVGVERIAALATTSAKAAHELHIAVKSGGVPIGTDGASVALNLILPDGVSTTADGSIDAGVCIAMLPPLCYQRGETRGVLLLQFGTQAAIPVYAFVLRCFEDLTDAFADPDHVIPSLSELLAQLDAAKNAAKAAENGASAANAAADNASAAAEDAAAAAKGANDAASAANAAAQTANAASARLNALTATATGLPAGSEPTVAVTTGEDGAKRLAFGIPKGDKGDTGAIGPQGPKGDTGDIGSLTINGKAPDGSGAVTLTMSDIDGLSDAIANAGGVKTVSGVSPDSSGNVPLTAKNVGALPSGATAADSSKLGGQLPAFYATAEEVAFLLYDGAGAHNAVYRGKDLGTAVTDAQWVAISAGTFEDLYIGDYWVINGINWRIAAFDYYYRSGDTDCTTHHVVIVPDTALYTAQMNTSNVTTGAYVGSAMYTSNLANAKTAINNAFGSGHILSHRQYLQNATTSAYASAGSWYDSTVELMTEQNVYGCKVFGNCINGTNFPNSYTVDRSQYPLFAFRPDLISNRITFWLRDVVSDVYFAIVRDSGISSSSGAINANGVRPAFSIC
ncbi:MAG: hypothetical protein PUH70_08685 [Clostridiales bacterium]|nr:hypothetical protein [Clostridiales bacterium]MDY5514698.1 hypothetical protein [Candidatus Ventricola sp.]